MASEKNKMKKITSIAVNFLWPERLEQQALQLPTRPKA